MGYSQEWALALWQIRCIATGQMLFALGLNNDAVRVQRPIRCNRRRTRSACSSTRLAHRPTRHPQPPLVGWHTVDRPFCPDLTP